MYNIFEEHKQHAFDCFCKKVLKHEARDHYDQVRRGQEKETLFSELSAFEDLKNAWVDDYPSDCFEFPTFGYYITVKDEMIADAIAALPQDRRDIILLSYFLGLSDKEIGNKLGLERRTVQSKRKRALREIQKRMEKKL